MSVINGYRYLIKEGGVKSLWRGNGVNVLKIIPETAIRFAVFAEVGQILEKDLIVGCIFRRKKY